MATRRAPSPWTAGALGALVVAMAACTSWMPPAFSPALSSDEACVKFVGGPNPGTAAALPGGGAASAAAADGVGSGASAAELERQIRDVQAARKLYIHVARCLTQDSSIGSAALLGLSSLALFKGVTSPHPKDMAGAGVVGGFTYLNTSGDAGAVQRRQVYYRGAEALGCALRAVEPYRLPASTRDQDDKPVGMGTLITRALAARSALLEPERQLRIHADTPATERIAGRPAAEGCSRISRGACSDPGSGGSEAERALAQACRTIEARCTAIADTTVTKAVHPAVKLMLADIVKARDDIDRLMGDATALEGVVDVAARNLESQSTTIQTMVAREVDKTFPDPDAVLKSVGSLRSVAFNVSRAPAFGDSAAAPAPPASAAGETHSTGRSSGAPRFKDVPVAEFNNAQAALREAQHAGTRLRHALQRVQQRVAAVNTDLRTCVPAAPPAGSNAPAENGGPTPNTPSAPPPAPAPTTTPTVIATDIDRDLIRSLLGLPATATGDEVKAKLQACQQKVVNQPGATGVTIDADAMAALVKGLCKGAIP